MSLCSNLSDKLVENLSPRDLLLATGPGVCEYHKKHPIHCKSLWYPSCTCKLRHGAVLCFVSAWRPALEFLSIYTHMDTRTSRSTSSNGIYNYYVRSSRSRLQAESPLHLVGAISGSYRLSGHQKRSFGYFVNTLYELPTPNTAESRLALVLSMIPNDSVSPSSMGIAPEDYPTPTYHL